MSDTTPEGERRLRLIEGGQRESFRVGQGVVRLFSGVGLPAGAGALVCEEDTMQVLGAALELRPVNEHPVRVLTAAAEAQPVAPGSVLSRGRAPRLLRAVIHDLDREPSWQEGWIRSALAEVLRQVAAQKIDGLALPLLGTIHGRLPLDRALLLTFEALTAAQEALPARLWLMVPAASQRDLRAQLDQLIEGLDGGDPQ